MSKFPPGHWALRRRGFRIPRFARIGQSSLTPSLLLSNANPLRWALRWGPPSAAYWVENYSRCGFTAAPGFAELTVPVRFPPQERPLRPPESLPPVRGKVPPKGADEGDLLARSPTAEALRTSPIQNPNRFRSCRRGGTCPSRRPLEPHLSLTGSKGALPTGRRTTQRLPETQRQR